MFEVSIGAFEINSTTGKVFVTGQFFTILELENHMESEFKEKDKFLNFIESILKNPEEEEEDVYILNPSKWVKIKTAEVEDLVYGIVMDVTSEILEKNQIKKDRDLDALTKLLNRKGFQRQFEIWQQKEYSGTSALLMFDLDNLKIINDTYGHKWGDQYITQTVARLKKITDDDHKILGRRSGDEFVLLLYDFESKDSIRKCISDFHENLSKETIKFPDGTDKFISISAGLMWIDHFDLSYDELLHYADEALYESKRNNRGSFSESRY
jgi:diguanylate cyclase (GGDEF)-like protein